MQPNGQTYRLLFSPDQDRIKVQHQTVQGRWQEYCEHGWLAHEQVQKHIERFLDNCGTFLLISRGYKDIVTSRKRSTIESRELSSSLHPQAIQASEARPNAFRKRQTSDRHKRAEEIRSTYPLANKEWLVVDTDGKFKYLDAVWCVTAQQYAPRSVKNGNQLYTMDHVQAVTAHDDIHFYDQNLNEVECRKEQLNAQAGSK